MRPTSKNHSHANDLDRESLIACNNILRDHMKYLNQRIMERDLQLKYYTEIIDQLSSTSLEKQFNLREISLN